jgi:hypothetical protein
MVQSDPDTASAPDDSLPAPARLVLQRWRAARQGATLPALHDLAPARVPAELLPWSMTYRRDGDRNLTYGVVGEELAFLFHGNPRGKAVLYYADPAVRAARHAIMHRSLDEGRPVWYLGRLLFETGPVAIGRLCLPTRIDSGEALLLIYIPFAPLPGRAADRHRPLSTETGDAIWIDRGPA